MKLTDYVAEFLYTQHIKHIFVLQGGAALHLIDSIERHPSLTAVPMQHEQSSAMAADGYAKASNNFGVTISTSGPGATNLLTGIACSYFDSIPTLHITGNVASFRQSDDLDVRQYGFQETDIVSMATPITKYAVRISSPEEILTELPKALRIAKEGRPGPVLIDIPDNFQRENINELSSANTTSVSKAESDIEQYDFSELTSVLALANRPVIIFGAGVLNSHSKDTIVQLAERLRIPYFTTWPLKGIRNASDQLNLGGFGTHALRGNNIILQNADFILSLGSRLDSRATAKLDTFARAAKIAMVDVDANEIGKFAKLNKAIHYSYTISCEHFVTQFAQQCAKIPNLKTPDDWFSYIRSVQSKFNTIPKTNGKHVDPYLVSKTISEQLQENDIITVDTGTCLPLTLVYGDEKKGQQYISSYNNTPMGYALPSAIGAHFATGKAITCINGDGGLQMNIQELATIANFKLPIKIWVYNNQGHCMIKQTQDDWLDGKHFAADHNNGLPKLSFDAIASSYGIKSKKVTSNEELERVLYTDELPMVIDIDISPSFRYEPIIKYGNPLENMTPILSGEMIDEYMLIPPIHTPTLKS